MTPKLSKNHLLLAAAALLLVSPPLLQGQQAPSTPRDTAQPVRPVRSASGRATATRDELKAMLSSGSNLSNSEAASVRQRLDQGDFQSGDRVLLAVFDEPTLSDTFAVRPGSILSLPNLPDLSLKGVLRSELQPHLEKHIRTYIRNPTIEASALIRLAVLGEVAEPGFYTLPAETLASEAVMAAGGPSQKADLRKTTIRRGGSEVATRDEVQEAFGKGQSLDQLNLQGGDEIMIGSKGPGILPYLQAAGAVAGLTFALSRIF